MGRAGEVGDIAPVIAFLISEENSHVTGMEIKADGGLQWQMKAPEWDE